MTHVDVSYVCTGMAAALAALLIGPEPSRTAKLLACACLMVAAEVLYHA